MGQADVLDWLKANPGQHDANAIAAGAGVRLGNVYKVTATLRRQKRIGYTQVDGAYLYWLPVRVSRPLKHRGPIPKPRGRAGRSIENRTGQAWRAGSAQVVVDGRLIDCPMGSFTCGCGEIVYIDTRGFAACGSCGAVYNDGNAGEQMKISNREKKRRMGEFRAECQRKF